MPSNGSPMPKCLGERGLLAGVPFGPTAPKSCLRRSGACLGGCGACLGSLGLEFKNVYLIQGLTHSGCLSMTYVHPSKWPGQ